MGAKPPALKLRGWSPQPRHERIMLQFFPIILLRIAQKFPRLFSIFRFSTFFDIIHCIGTGGIIIIGGVESELKL